ncbi:MAG: hypothetical protein H0V19_06890, partial [Euzebyales bacterium]|nr:hypothetical protein [Euzebyales bacterium]
MRVGARALAAGGLAVALLGMAAPPAGAGGVSQIEWERPFLVVGERAAGTIDAGFSADMVRQVVAHGDYELWLRLGPMDWEEGPRQWLQPAPDRIRVPAVSLRPEPRGAFVDARIGFRVPDVRPGRYTAVLCVDGCTETFAGSFPSEVQVVATSVEGRLHERLARQVERGEIALSRVEARLQRRIRRSTVTSVNTDSALRGDVDA